MQNLVQTYCRNSRMCWFENFFEENQSTPHNVSGGQHSKKRWYSNTVSARWFNDLGYEYCKFLGVTTDFGERNNFLLANKKDKNN